MLFYKRSPKNVRTYHLVFYTASFSSLPIFVALALPE